MGKQIHLEKVKELFDKSPVLDLKSIERVIGSKKNNYAKLLVSNLIRSGKIHKIGRGVYTKHEESSLAVFAFKPSYIGLQSALSFYGVWEQETIPVIITTKKVRRGIRVVIGSNILIRNIGKKYFFGFNLEKEGSFYFPYSDLEKTVIDMIVFNQKMSKDVIKKINEKINEKKLYNYLQCYDKRIKKRVLIELKE